MHQGLVHPGPSGLPWELWTKQILGAEKIGNLSTVYSEAEPGSRASGAGEGNLSVIPHRGPSACSRPRGPTARQHVLREGGGGGGEKEAREELLLHPLSSPQPLSVPGRSGARRRQGRRRSGACSTPVPPRAEAVPGGRCRSWRTLHTKTPTEEPQTLDAAPSGGQACRGSVAQAPPTSTLSV